MTLYEFQRERCKQLDDFVNYWLDRHEKSPEQYPLSMESGDWDEQIDLAAESNLT